MLIYLLVIKMSKEDSEKLFEYVRELGNVGRSHHTYCTFCEEPPGYYFTCGSKQLNKKIDELGLSPWKETLFKNIPIDDFPDIYFSEPPDYTCAHNPLKELADIGNSRDFKKQIKILKESYENVDDLYSYAERIEKLNADWDMVHEVENKLRKYHSCIKYHQLGAKTLAIVLDLEKIIEGTLPIDFASQKQRDEKLFEYVRKLGGLDLMRSIGVFMIPLFGPVFYDEELKDKIAHFGLSAYEDELLETIPLHEHRDGADSVTHNSLKQLAKTTDLDVFKKEAARLKEVYPDNEETSWFEMNQKIWEKGGPVDEEYATLKKEFDGDMALYEEKLKELEEKASIESQLLEYKAIKAVRHLEKTIEKRFQDNCRRISGVSLYPWNRFSGDKK